VISVSSSLNHVIDRGIAYASRGRARVKVVKFRNPCGRYPDGIPYLYGAWAENEAPYPHRVLYRIRSKERS
jgi:hypothetical protein